ncbi:hypothetical protein [Reyranella sp. CPCC 100927]|uniref:hypothetical protein n=1 Tax=Reyranella sp. CPCC 100927 TaxID=2599616 RepID=UPI0011B5160E|nr:hypothetical protein [Reyranella sp. CPCC 100927]TWS95811.1 hypothetical protein FQU96_40060 [Reyranella sp. CPCC 100927]
MAELNGKEALRIAIGLFRASADSKSTDGAPVLTKLEEAAKLGKIVFENLGGLEGDTNLTTGVIRMSEYLIAEPAKLSIWLVHEGFHAAAKRGSLEIDEEIESRSLQARYWQSLMAGVSFEGKKYTVKSGMLLEMHYKNRILDWVLTMPDYTNTKGFLTARWIIAHIQHWGGPANREKNTRQMYIAELMKPPSLTELAPGARALFDILRSAPLAEARDLITFVGGGDFAKGRKMIAERIGKVWGGSAVIEHFTNDVVAWQKMTAIDLGMVPRAR